MQVENYHHGNTKPLQNAYHLHFVESSHVNTIPKQEILNIEILYYNKKNIDMKKREMFPRC